MSPVYGGTAGVVMGTSIDLASSHHLTGRPGKSLRAAGPTHGTKDRLAAFGFAVWAGSADDPARQQLIGGWFGMLLGVGLVLRGGVRMREGEVRLSSRTVRREENPGLYRIGLAFLVVPGVIMIGGGIYLLLGG